MSWSRYRQRFEHILVDEYQDTNQAQNEIVLTLAGGHHNVCVVGDTDQCLPAGTLVRRPRATCRSSRSPSVTRCSAPAERRSTRTGVVSHVHRSARTSRSCGSRRTGRAAGSSWRRRPTTSCRPVSCRSPAHTSCTSCTEPIVATGSVARPACGRCSPVGSGRAISSQQPGARRRHVGPADLLERCRGLVLRVAVRRRVRPADGLLPRQSAGRWPWTTAGSSASTTGSIPSTRAKALMDDLLLHPDFPHHRPQNGARRSTINLTMFSDARSGRRTTGAVVLEPARRRRSVDAGRHRAATGQGGQCPLRDVVEGLRPRPRRRQTGRPSPVAWTCVGAWRWTV